MSKLIILRGNSGSGKSSVAKRLQREFGRNTLLIPQDVVRRWWNEKDFIGFIREKILDETVSLKDAVCLVRSDVMAGEFPENGGGKICDGIDFLPVKKPEE